MARVQFRAVCAAILLGGASLAPAAAQYPERNVTLIVPYGAGGGTDITARMLAKDLEAVLGKPVTVENRAGGTRRIHDRLSQCTLDVCGLSRQAI